MTRQSIRGLAALLTERGKALNREICLISDEPYSEIIYDGVTVPSVMTIYPHSFIASSYSKSLSLPGERIGYIAVNPAMSWSRGGHGRHHPLQPDPWFCERPRADAAGDRRPSGGAGGRGDLPEKTGSPLRRPRLRRLPGGTKPEGAFYLFPKTPIADDVRFADALRERRILTVPGSGFYGPGHIRIAYCVDDATILGAIEGFGEVWKEFK